MKIISVSVASLLLATVLTGCSGPSGQECTSLASSGPAVDSVDVTGGFGESPTVTFPTPLETTTTERKILIEGDGAPALPGGSVTLDFAIYNGETGEALGQTSFDGSDAQTTTLDSEALIPGLVATIQCAPAGSQVVSVIAPDDMKDPEGNTIGDLSDTATLVVVADIISTSLDRAQGEKQPPVSGMPQVTLDSNGVPGITVPNTDAPTSLEVAVLIKGSGEVVKPGSTVTVHYTGVLWSNGEVFDSSWSTGNPATFSLSGVVPGFAQAIEGQTVGSQVLAVIPPDLAYGDQDMGMIPAGSTLVFVIDILGTTSK